MQPRRSFLNSWMPTIQSFVTCLVDTFYPQTASASAAIITGPSRITDIEIPLASGVHGPNEVHVFLVDDSQPE
jgi:L-lactate utilization protein LutC